MRGIFTETMGRFAVPTGLLLQPRCPPSKKAERDVFHACAGHVEVLLASTAKSVDLKPTDRLHPCQGCLAVEGRLFVDLSGSKEAIDMGGICFAMVLRNDPNRHLKGS